MNHILPKQAKSTRFDSTERQPLKLPIIAREPAHQTRNDDAKNSQSLRDILRVHKKHSSSVQGRNKTPSERSMTISSRPETRTQHFPWNVRQSSQQARPLAGLLTLGEEENGATGTLKTEDYPCTINSQDSANLNLKNAVQSYCRNQEVQTASAQEAPSKTAKTGKH